MTIFISKFTLGVICGVCGLLAVEIAIALACVKDVSIKEEYKENCDGRICKQGKDNVNKGGEQSGDKNS